MRPLSPISLALLAILWATAAPAATLKVGKDEAYDTPSAAIAKARDGDTVTIAPGQYVDCAATGANNLTIEGSAAGVVMTSKPCQGKGLLVLGGNNVTVRNLTLQHVRVPDGNGAGIRAEGGDLTVDNVQFLDNENGILANPDPNATLRITNSAFLDNGKCDSGYAHGVYAGAIKLLHIEHSRFLDTHHGHHVKSRALRTELINCDIADGPDGNSSYLIDVPNGGALLVQGSRLEKGPHTENHGFAIVIGEEGVTHPTGEILIKNNVFTNDTGAQTMFVRNLTAAPAQLLGNTLQGPDIRPLSGDGTAR
jgi:hypothetical protein